MPFTDVMGNAFFCQIAGAYFSGLTNGTSATTFSPTANVTREQVAAFATRTLDQSLKRGSQRAALNQFWTTTPQYDLNLGTTQVGNSPYGVQSDGSDLWVVNRNSSTISRVRASDGKLIETWTAGAVVNDVLIAMGRVFITSFRLGGGRLYMIDPSLPAGAATEVTRSLPDSPFTLAFDGFRIWVANPSNSSVSIVIPGATLPWAVQTITTGFIGPNGILFDGSNIWVSNTYGGTIVKLDANGNIIQTVSVGGSPVDLTFDGTNIWVPNQGSTDYVSVVRASTGEIIATLAGNGLDAPARAAFDGERIMVTNAGANRLSLWKATDLTPIGAFTTGTGNNAPADVCSDGINFWITFQNGNRLARF